MAWSAGLGFIVDRWTTETTFSVLGGGIALQYALRMAPQRSPTPSLSAGSSGERVAYSNTR
jgi:hypothetical protein